MANATAIFENSKILTGNIMIPKYFTVAIRHVAAAAMLLVGVPQVQAEYTIDYAAEAIAVAGSGDFAPYYIMSNRHGVITQSKDALLRGRLWRPMDTDRRFSYGFGVDLVGGWGSAVDYGRVPFIPSFPESGYNPALEYTGRHPAAVWIQQLYGEVKYRGVFLTAGLKEHASALLNHRLSSGDLVESGNSRPMPEVRIGFIDFQDIPFTNGWLQIQGEISYGKRTDDKWTREHYNYTAYHLNQGALFTYKRCYFRTKPSQPFSATFGMQFAGQFGGHTEWYTKGFMRQERHFSKGIKQFFKMFLPTDGGLEYYTGSSLGSWDVVFRYKLNCEADIKAYFQKPFEDGSGIGFLNGWDGVWGVELATNRRGPVTGIVAEYLDFTNQSGPIHWDPDDRPGSGVKNRAEGADNYYNNHEFNSYACYGMAIGSPFMVSPIYNTDGWPSFLYNRVRGFHVGVEGEISREIGYRVLGGYRRSWGNGYIPLMEPKSDTSVMAEVRWLPASVKGLGIKGQLGIDHGKLLGNNFGACISVSYTGAIKL